MIRRTITEADLRRRMASMLRAVERGEHLTITREGQPIARLLPVGATPRVRVRPKTSQDAQQAAPWVNQADMEQLLSQVKERRQELVAAMELARSVSGGAVEDEPAEASD